ncbi:MAG: hypothetical protein LBH85_03575, partial [Treponema sp.]|nr:hypothetical protein [Treponema sp.]
CGGDDDSGNTDPKKIVITGLDGESGEVAIMLFSSFSDDGMIAMGGGEISENSVALPLYKFDGDEDESTPPTTWTGSGAYYLMLSIREGEEEGGATYLYTGGKTLAELEITGQESAAKAPKYNITTATSTIAFDQFIDITQYMEYEEE